jgi:hypothetical protein
MTLEVKKAGRLPEQSCSHTRWEGEEALRLWLSASSFDHIRKLHSIRTPKVWMLTGICRLDGASVFSVESHSPTTEVGITSVAISPLTKTPIGGGFGVGPGHNHEVAEGAARTTRMAPQYRRLDVEYIRVKEHDLVPAPSRGYRYCQMSLVLGSCETRRKILMRPLFMFAMRRRHWREQ